MVRPTIKYQKQNNCENICFITIATRQNGFGNKVHTFTYFQCLSLELLANSSRVSILSLHGLNIKDGPVLNENDLIFKKKIVVATSDTSFP